MRILFLVPYAPTSIRTRPYNLLHSLARIGCDLTLATCWEDHEEQDAMDAFKASEIKVIARPLSKFRRSWNLALSLFDERPMQSHYSWQPRLFQGVVQELLQEPYDILHIEHLRGAIFGLQLRSWMRQAGIHLPLVWDSVDCISHLFEQAAQSGRNAFGRIITRLELGRTRKYEAALSQQFDRILFTSEVDAQAYRSLDGFSTSQPITVLPNGVDLEYFTPGLAPRDENTVIFSGKLSYHANVAAAMHLVQDIMPLVWERRPQSVVLLAGKDPDPALRRLCKREPRLQITGSVADLRPYLRSACLSVAPILYGAGIQNKVLEAMASGTPVIAYPIAVSGLQGITPGKEFLLAHSPPEFAEAILSLFDHKNQCQYLSENALRFVQSQYSWERTARTLETVYFEMIHPG